MSGYASESEEESLDTLGCPNGLSESEFIERIEKYIEEGGHVDLTIYPETSNEYLKGIPILLQAIKCGYADIVGVLLEKGASVHVESWIYHIEPEFPGFSCTSNHSRDAVYDERPWNALELAILKSIDFDQPKEIYELVKEKSLQRFSSYGLHPVHLESALGNWDELKNHLTNDASLVNKSIASDCPLWPGYTPLLLAAKFYRKRIVSKLLNLGADPKVKETKGRNTALHFLIPTASAEAVCDDRLFVYDEEDTFGDFNGMSHFHVACYCRAANVVERYLELGVSPDSGVKNKNVDYLKYRVYGDNTTGLHMSAEWLYSRNPSPTLARLLLEYGAKVDAKDARNNTPLQICRCNLVHSHANDKCLAELVCVLLESGASAAFTRNLDEFVQWLLDKSNEKRIFLQCLTRMAILRKHAITDQLKNYYDQVLQTTEDFDQVHYERICEQELDRLQDVGLTRELRDEANVASSFKRKFQALVGSAGLLTDYPIYGQLLRIKLRRRLIRFEEKLKKVDKAVPYVMFIFEEFCKLPHLCAENILWNFGTNELDMFLKIFIK